MYALALIMKECGTASVVALSDEGPRVAAAAPAKLFALRELAEAAALTWKRRGWYPAVLEVQEGATLLDVVRQCENARIVVSKLDPLAARARARELDHQRRAKKRRHA